MSKTRNFIKTILFLGILLNACKKEKVKRPQCVEEATNFETNSFAPFRNGSWWVYQKFSINPSTSIVTALNEYDSLYITGTKVINGINYSILEGKKFNTFNVYELIGIQDSKIINSDGVTLLDILSINDTVSKSSGGFPVESIATVFKSHKIILELPFGSLESEHSRELVFFMTSPFPTPLFERDFYVRDVGLAKYTSFFTSGTVIEMRLKNYFIGK